MSLSLVIFFSLSTVFLKCSLLEQWHHRPLTSVWYLHDYQLWSLIWLSIRKKRSRESRGVGVGGERGGGEGGGVCVCGGEWKLCHLRAESLHASYHKRPEFLVLSLRRRRRRRSNMRSHKNTQQILINGLGFLILGIQKNNTLLLLISALEKKKKKKKREERERERERGRGEQTNKTKTKTKRKT